MKRMSPTTPESGSPALHGQSLLLTGYLAVTVSLAVLAAWAHSVLQPSLHVFRSFAFELPWITSLLIDSTPYWGVLPVLSLAIGLYMLKRRRRGRDTLLAWSGLAALAVLTASLPFVALVGFYEPIRRLGDASGASCGLPCLAHEAWQRAQRPETLPPR